jgi:putative two-component system response regulator
MRVGDRVSNEDTPTDGPLVDWASGSDCNVVIVDDNANNLRVLSGMLEQAGYRVRPSISGEMALHSIELNLTDLILLDIRMPGADGYEICRRLKANARTRDIPVIFISALHEVEDKLAAFRAGGVDYVTKPFQMEEVVARVKTHVELHRMRHGLEQMVLARTHELEQTHKELRKKEKSHSDSLLQTIEAISLTIEKRDPYTAGHQKRVSGLAVALGVELGLGGDQLEGLRLGALIHDIGKINIPAEILNRPGRLDVIEMALVRPHPQAGYDIVAGIDLPWPVANMVVQHHERLDGSGYPGGLQADAICPEAKVLAVADVVEAMASHRPYRPALGIDLALDEIRDGSGTRYDPRVVDACVHLFESGRYLLEP